MNVPEKASSQSHQLAQVTAGDAELVFALTVLNTSGADVAARNDAARRLTREARAMAVGVLARLRRLGLEGMEREDFVQHLAEKACGRQATWTGTTTISARGWCYSVMYHYGIDQLRRYAVRQVALMPAENGGEGSRFERLIAERFSFAPEGQFQARVVLFALQRFMQSNTPAGRHLTALVESELDPRSIEEQSCGDGGLGPDATEQQRARGRNLLEKHRSKGRLVAREVALGELA